MAIRRKAIPPLGKRHASRPATDWQDIAGTIATGADASARGSPNGAGHIRMARRAQREGARPPDAASAGRFSARRVGTRTRQAVRAADPASRDRILLAPSPGARRQARPRARGEERRARWLDLAAGKPRQGGTSGELPRAARALSRGRARAGPGPLLRVRPAGVPARLAPRPVGRPPAQQERELAQLLRRRLEPVDGAERPSAPPQGAAGPPLPAHRRAPLEGRRGRSPRAAVRGVARPPRARVAAAAGVLGRAEPAGRQPLRPRDEMRAGIRRPGAAAGHASPRRSARTDLISAVSIAPVPPRYRRAKIGFVS